LAHHGPAGALAAPLSLEVDGFDGCDGTRIAPPLIKRVNGG
jgi:hypothetical protein